MKCAPIFTHLFWQGIKGNLLALIAGATLTLAFAPFNLFLLAFFSTCLLLALLSHLSPKQAFWRGGLYGVGLFSTGIYWVFISIHTFGEVPTLISLLITAGFITLLAFFLAIHSYLLNALFPTLNASRLLIAFPVLFVLIEWIRSWLLSGFPWLLLGYSQLHSPLRGYAPLFSVYGVSFFTGLSSGLIVYAILTAKQKKWCSLFISLFFLVLCWVLGGIFSHIAWVHPKGPPVKVSLVQGNIPQNLKWTIDQVLPTLSRYQQLSETHWDSNIIVWPEAAIPLTAEQADSFLSELKITALSHGSTLITGIPIKNPTQDTFYNAVIAIGAGHGLYIKHRLVPFGEYVPAPAFLNKWFDLLKIPLPSQASETEISKPLIAGNILITAFICYEIAFPEQVAHDQYYTNGDILLTVSNDAWFGQSIALAQHLQMAAMRALEVGRPLLFVANTGITAIIDANGTIIQQAPAFESTVLTGFVQPTSGKTPWLRFALNPVLIILLVLLYIAIKSRKKIT